METEIVGVVGRLKTMEVPPLRQLDVNVGVGACRNGRRSPCCDCGHTQIYTCRICTPVINLQSSSLLYSPRFFSHSSAGLCFNSSRYRSALVNVGITRYLLVFNGLNLCVLLGPGSPTRTCLPSTPCAHLPA